MRFNNLVHHRSLPSQLSSHQILNCSVLIHDLVTDALTPQLDSKPKYQALAGMLSTMQFTISELNLAHNRSQFKDPKKMRGVGSVDGKTGDETLARQKQLLFRKRMLAMARFRNFVQVTKVIALKAEVTAAATTINDLLNKRINRFERDSYAESTVQFRHFIESVDNSSEAVNALVTLDLVEQYDAIKLMQDDFVQMLKQHTGLDAKREKMPKVVPATRDLRHTVTIILSNLHFDIESGDDTFSDVLGHIDEVIDKELAVARSRKTRAENAKKEADKNGQNKDQSSDQSQTQNQDQTQDKPSDDSQNQAQDQAQSSSDQAADASNDASPETSEPDSNKEAETETVTTS